MKRKYTELGKWVLFYALGIVGVLAFMVLAGEIDEMPLGKFFLYKMVAMAVLALCFYIGKRLHRAGLLPTKIYEEIEEDEI